MCLWFLCSFSQTYTHTQYYYWEEVCAAVIGVLQKPYSLVYFDIGEKGTLHHVCIMCVCECPLLPANHFYMDCFLFMAVLGKYFHFLNFQSFFFFPGDTSMLVHYEQTRRLLLLPVMDGWGNGKEIYFKMVQHEYRIIIRMIFFAKKHYAIKFVCV